jgi:hypothetical protein
MPERSTSVADDDWVDTAYAGARLGFSTVTIWRMAKAGLIPSMRAGSARRIPRLFVEDARAAVMSGGQVELRDFARQWAAQGTPAAIEAIA